MEHIASTPWFVVTVAIVGIIGAIASIIGLTRRAAKQKVKIGGSAKGKISVRDSTGNNNSQEILIAGDSESEISQTRTK